MTFNEIYRYLETQDIPSGLRPDYLYSLYRYIDQLLEGKATVVEIGCYEGPSTLCMAAAMKKGHLYTIDPVFITGQYLARDCNDPTGIAYSSSLALLEKRLTEMKLRDQVTIITNWSGDVLKYWNQPISMVVIDGEHTYEAVTIDCGWLEHVDMGGYAVFDDWMHDIEQAVRDYIKDKPEWKILHESTKPPEGDGGWVTATILRKQEIVV